MIVKLHDKIRFWSFSKLTRSQQEFKRLNSKIRIFKFHFITFHFEKSLNSQHLPLYFQIDLVEDIPMQDDEDMDDVTIIEPVSTSKLLNLRLISQNHPIIY